MTETLFAGIDLHGNNVVIGIVNNLGRRLKHQKLACDLEQIDGFLSPWKSQLQSLAIESTFNWYWLVDGLQARGYPVALANPARIDQYNGIKYADDQNDAYFLAELQRLGILPTGHIYDAQLRPVRDLLRRRLSLVQQRTALMLSSKSLHTRTTGRPLALSRLKSMSIEEAGGLYEHPANNLIAQVQKEHIERLDQSIKKIEKAVLACARQLPCYRRLCTLPGIGVILAMTITMETGDVQRFKSPGDFASYCRTVQARRLSNQKEKGRNNRKCGNKHLSWAFVEGANFAKRFDEHCRRWFDRKAARSGTVLATKALACKMAKAAWHLMKHDSDYDAQRMFALAAQKQAA